MAVLQTHAHQNVLPPLDDPKELAAWIYLRRRRAKLRQWNDRAAHRNLTQTGSMPV